ncbi:MAG: hypothetical protein WCN92_00065 [Eubacteriales bacterium]
MSIVYIISKIITLPGAYVKTFWEHLMCRLLGLPVETTNYLHYDEALGHVEHEFAKTLPRSFLFCWVPGFINRIFGIVMLFAGSLGIFYLGVGPINLQTGVTSWIFYVYLVLLYFGISLLCNIFPLVEDALLLWDKLYGENGANIVWKILLFIPSVCMLAGAYIERFGINILLAVGFVVAGYFM